MLKIVVEKKCEGKFRRFGALSFDDEVMWWF